MGDEHRVFIAHMPSLRGHVTDKKIPNALVSYKLDCYVNKDR